MNRLSLAIIYVNFIGLAVCQGLESWRWGTISAVIPLGLVWLISLVLLGATILLTNKKEQA